MKKVSFFFGFILMVSMVQAQSSMQQVISSAGGTKSASGGSWYIGWTLGETITSTWKSSDGSLTVSSGLQQNVTITAIEETPGWDVKLILYPNPVGTQLTIQFKEPVVNTILVYLLDLNGKIIYTDRVEESSFEKSIDMEVLKPGIYILKLIDGLKSNTYKVVKL
jgi:hypothetical protein